MPGEQVGSAYVTLGLDSSKFDSGMGQAEGKLRGFAGSMANILKVGAVAGGAAIAGAATLGIKSFVDYESGLYDIAKVTGMTGDELKGLGEGLRAMSLESGQAVTGLEAIAAIAGQMGMQGSADILKFTETVNQASVAFGIAPEAAAAAMGKIGNIWDIPTQELYKMGSAVNYLGNTTNASEAQLLDYMMAIGNQPRVLGMTSQETLLFGSTLVSMGMDASDAGTRLNAAFGQQGLIGHLPAAAKQLGVTEAALKGMIDADPTDTVLRLIDSMSGITSETERLQVAQEIFGAIGGKAIVPLIGRTDQFRASLGNVNTEYEKGTAMAEEYKTRWGALGVQLSRVRQGINDVAITIGEGLAPYVRGFADLLNNDVLPAVNSFIAALMAGDWDTVGQKIGGVAKTIATAFTAALGGAALVAGIATLAPVLLTAFAGLAAAVSGQVGAIAAGIGGRFALMKGAAIGHILALKTAAVGHFVTMKTQALTQIGAMVTGTITRYGQMAAGAIASLITMTATVIGNFAMQKAIALSHLVAIVPLVGAKYAMMAQASIYNFGIMVTTQAVAWGQMVAGAVTNLATMVGRTAIGFASMAASALGAAARMAAGVVGSFATMAAGALAQVARMVAGIAISVVGMAAGLVASIAGPVALIIAGIAGIGLALIADWDAVGSALAGAFSHAKEVVGELYDMIKAGDYSGAVKKLGDEFKQAARWAYNSIRGIDWKGALTKGYEAIKTFGQNILTTLKNVNWKGIFEEASTTVKGFATTAYEAIKGIKWDDVKAGAVTAFESIRDTVFKIGSWVAEAIKNIKWDDIKSGAIGAFEGVKSTIAGISTYVMDSLAKINWKGLGESAAQAIKSAIDILSNIGSQIADWIRSGLRGDFGSDASGAAERIKAGFAALTGYWEEFKTGLSTIKWEEEGRNLAEKIKGGIAEIKDWADGILDNLKTGFSDWINSNGPGKLGEDLAKAIANGAAKIGQWIADKLKGGDSKKAITDAFNYLGGLVDWAILAGKAAWSFVSGFAKTLISYGKGTVGAAILDIFANAFRGLNDKIPDWLKPLLGGLGDVADRIDDLAQSWRDAMPPLDTSVDVEVEYSGTDPSTLDGQTFKSTLLVDTKYADSSGTPIPGITGSTAYRPFTNERLYKYKDQQLTAAELGKQLADEGWTREDVTASFGPLNEWMISTLGVSGGPKWQYTDKDFDKILEGFDSAGGAADKLDRVLQSGEQLFKEFIGDFDRTWKESSETLADAIKSNTAAMTTSQRVAANALKLGGEIGGKLLGEGGNAVRIGLDASGREIAIIGRVAQENFVKAGGVFTDGIQTSTTRASNTIQLGHQQAASQTTGAATTAGNTAKTAATTAGITTTTNAQKAANSINSGADQARAKIAAAGDVGTKLTIGAQYAANAIVSAGSSFASAVRGAITAFMSNASYYRNPFQTPQYKPSGFAIGTKTTGPELAMIGEDGPSWPEFIIPTKTKRWDLLMAALRAYGVRGFAEGGSTGGASGGDASVGFSGSIIISIGKLNQAVVRALADIVNRFRTSWAVIKAETTKHWIALTSNTNAELSQYRSVVAQAMSEARTAVLSAWTDLLDRGKILWTEGRESMSQQAAYLADNIRLAADNTRIAVSDLWQTTKDEINNGIMEVQTVWQNGWAKIEADLATAAGNIKSKVQEIAALLKSISGASVNISVGGFIGGGGGGSGGGGGGGGSAADQFINQYFGDTTCQIDELSGMSPGLIQSLIQSGAWSPNNSALSQKIAQAYGYGTSAAQVLGGAGMAAAKGIAGGIGAALAGGSIGDSTYVTRQGQLVGGTVGTGYASQSSSWGSMASQAARGSSGVYKIGGYDAGGISARPQIAVVSGRGEPEIHLTKSNVREFLGDIVGGDTIVHVHLGNREVTDLVMKQAVSKMRTKGLQMG